MTGPTRPRTRHLAATIGTLLVLVAAASCTGAEPKQTARSSTTSATPSATTSAAAPAEPSAPLRVQVTRVQGRLSPASRHALETNVGATISAYLDAAFLTGTYPRRDFSRSFGAFTPGAARRARADVGLLTNKSFGATTDSVRAVRRAAYLSVLAPYEVAAGVTAKVDLLLDVARDGAPTDRVHLVGRLLLTRDASNGWKIFGYDLARSDTPRSAS